MIPHKTHCLWNDLTNESKQFTQSRKYSNPEVLATPVPFSMIGSSIQKLVFNFQGYIPLFFSDSVASMLLPGALQKVEIPFLHVEFLSHTLAHSLCTLLLVIPALFFTLW